MKPIPRWMSLLTMLVVGMVILAACGGGGAPAPAPAADSPLRHTASVLAVALGDDSGSRLHWELVDPGRVESAGCGVDLSHGNGFLAASFSGDPELAAENLGIVKRVLGEVQKDGITDDELAQAKTKISDTSITGNRAYRSSLVQKDSASAATDP